MPAAMRPAPPTIKDIAARAGVSISTVHYALRRTRPISDETRRRVLEAVESLDYHPHAGAATLPSGRTGRLAVVIRGLAAAAEQEDHTVVLYTAYGRRAAEGWRPAHVMRRREADGILLAGTQISEDHLAELADMEAPCVLLNREHAALPWIVPDRRQGAFLGATHLLNSGRRRIGLLGACYPGGVPDLQRPELLGFQDAFEARGVASDPALSRFVPVGETPGTDTAEARAGEAVRTLTAGARDDAGLLVFSYTLGPSVARAIRRSGARVPEDLAVVFGDEDPVARQTLP